MDRRTAASPHPPRPQPLIVPRRVVEPHFPNEGTDELLDGLASSSPPLGAKTVLALSACFASDVLDAVLDPLSLEPLRGLVFCSPERWKTAFVATSRYTVKRASNRRLMKADGIVWAPFYPP